ncbi:MAG: hypothetical protein FWF81_06800 [Defluviitaleaceae bacterium]|nr:hypothetical protein [Defluviitaleaceae bacterium]
MVSGINPSQLPILSNITSNTQGLSNREKEILCQIREKISSELGVPVKINMGQQLSNGMTISLTGFAGASADGTRSPLVLTKNILAEMASDERKYDEWMAWIRTQMQELISLENSLQENVRQAEAMDADLRSQQIRTNMMSALDFWNENSSGFWTQLGQGQAVQHNIVRAE